MDLKKWDRYQQLVNKERLEQIASLLLPFRSFLAAVLLLCDKDRRCLSLVSLLVSIDANPNDVNSKEAHHREDNNNDEHAHAHAHAHAATVTMPTGPNCNNHCLVDHILTLTLDNCCCSVDCLLL